MKRTHLITGLHTAKPISPQLMPNSYDVVGPYSLLTPLPNNSKVIVSRNAPKKYTKGWLL